MVKMELIEARENVSQPFTKILRSFYMFIQDSRYLDIYSLDYSGFYTKYPPSCSYVLDHLVSRKPRTLVDIHLDLLNVPGMDVQV